MEKVSKRSKRLRKKLYVDEFAVMGFEFTCKIDMESETAYDAFFDGIIALIESRGLYIGGGGNKDYFEAYVSSGERYGSATDEDIKAVESWLSSQEGISEIQVAELTDVYYGF